MSAQPAPHKVSDNVSMRSVRALESVDAMPAGLRSCVHDYGFAIVHAFTTQGITKPKAIRHLVNECWRGARQPMQKKKAPQCAVGNLLDWLLIQNNAGISAQTLLRVLYDNNLAIVSRNPTDTMVNASLAAVTWDEGKVATTPKHRRRLAAALKAEVANLWPHLISDTEAKA